MLLKKHAICFVLFLVLSLALPVFAANAPMSATSVPVFPESGVPAPQVSAASAALFCDGMPVWSENGGERLPMASTTKIMTALVALESGDVMREVKIDRRACGVEGSSIYLTEGEVLTMEELLYALLLESANDAAAAIAYEIAGGIPEFAGLMNETAERLGLSNTHFMNPHGLDDPEHYTTAEDLARLTTYALENEAFATIVSTYKKTIPLHGDEGVRMLLNHNRLLKQYDDVIGVKTGFTKRSGRCLVSAAKRDGVTVVAVTLNAPDDWRDHRAMQEYGFSRYESRCLAAPGSVEVEIRCPTAPGGVLRLTNEEGLTMTLPRGCEITRCVEAPHYVFPPVTEGEVYGRVVFSLTLPDGCPSNDGSGTEIGSLPLTAAEGVAEPEDGRGFFEKLFDGIKS